MNNTPKLYEVKHSYYCEPHNYYAYNDTNTEFEYPSLKEFYKDWGKADEDYNLLFRWDWTIDEETKEENFFCFWLQQRKGRYISTVTKVEKEDEPKIKEWLQKRYDHLIKLWQPLEK